MPWKDLRREDRRPLKGHALLRWVEDGEARQVRVDCIDVSANGLRVESWGRLPVRAYVTCLVMPLGIVTDANVRYSIRRGLKSISGLEFEELQGAAIADVPTSAG